jgi:hypothetical protein
MSEIQMDEELVKLSQRNAIESLSWHVPAVIECQEPENVSVTRQKLGSRDIDVKS